MENKSLIAKLTDWKAVAFLYLLIRLSYLDYIPMFDGTSFAHCTSELVKWGFNLFTFVCHAQGPDHAYGHPSILYLLLGLPQALNPDAQWIIHVATAFFHVAAIYFFYRLTEWYLTASRPAGNQWEVRLLTLAYGLHPVILANTINVSLDQPAAAFFLWSLYSLVFQKHGQFVLASFLAMTTKETSIVFYGAATFSYVVFFILRADATPRDRFGMLRRHWALAVPILLYALYLGIGGKNVTHAALLSEKQTTLLSTEIFQRAFLSYFVGFFVLNFSWLPTLFIAGAAGLFAGSWLVRREVVLPASTRTVWLLATFIPCYFVLTRYYPPTNVRYLVALTPFFLWFFAEALRLFFVTPQPRLVAIGVFAFLSVASLFYSMDPLSKKIYGTYKFGDHQILNMTSLTKEELGSGTDQGLYNLQFLQLHYAYDELMAQIGFHPLVVPDQIAGHLIGKIDKETFRRTFSMDRGGYAQLVACSRLDAFRTLPPEMLYAEFPMSTNLENCTAAIGKHYDFVAEIKFGNPGYQISAFRYALKSTRLSQRTR